MSLECFEECMEIGLGCTPVALKDAGFCSLEELVAALVVEEEVVADSFPGSTG
jgi:hypothetical protein